MFDSTPMLPADPILGLIQQYNNDKRPQKMDLGVGVYRNEKGLTPVLNAVKEAEKRILESEDSKAYLGALGCPDFNRLLREQVLGPSLANLQSITSIQTPGGCGALRLLAELIAKLSDEPRVWVSDPTWANHVPLIGEAGIELVTYPYYDFESRSINIEAMLEALSKAKAGDVVLLHGCCHNPSGADLTQPQWQQVLSLCHRQKLIPFIDLAYQGFGESLEEDAFGPRLAAEIFDDVLFSVSCSKNFGLYRERVGMAVVKCASANAAKAVSSQLASIARGIYSMPPSHGAKVVATILESDFLSALWADELNGMRNRIKHMRSGLRQALLSKVGDDRFRFIESQHGMFSFLGISEQQVQRLIDDHGIYMVDSSRINVAGLTENNLDAFASAVASVL
jgi:aspartate aminotransferase